MRVYRITREKYANTIEASGRSNRWNREKQYVIYAAASRSLAALELVAHRNAIMEGLVYKMVVIDLPDTHDFVTQVDLSKLPKKWDALENRFLTQKLGTDWCQEKQSPVLQVPSAIIKEEYNYIINTQHPDFSKVKIETTEDFVWDKRLL